MKIHKFNGLGQQNNHHIHTPQKLTHDKSPTTPQKDFVQPFETKASEGEPNSVTLPSKTTQTPPPTPIEETVLVHHKPKNEDENQNHQDDEDSSTTNLVAMTTKDEDTFDSLKREHGASVSSNNNINDTGSDAESKSVKSTNTDITDISVDKSNSTTPVRVEKGVEEESTKPTQERPSPALSAGRENTFPSQTTISSKQETRPASRISNVSFTSQMGMNELESLFNNPDLLSQSNWKARSKSHASPNRMATETARQDVQQKKVETKTINENKEDDSTGENKADDTPSTKRSKKDSRNEFFDFN